MSYIKRDVESKILSLSFNTTEPVRSDRSAALFWIAQTLFVFLRNRLPIMQHPAGFLKKQGLNWKGRYGATP